MKRSGIVTAIKTLVEANSYSFNQGFIYRINEYTGTYPVWMLTPIRLQDRKRDGSGSKSVYLCEAYIFTKNEATTETGKETIWEAQETLASKVFNGLDTLSRTTSDIMEVSGLSCEPDEFQIDQRGSISMKVSFTIKVYDC
ncbi:MAG: hypothetical protein WCX48_08465 [Bacteroidales bacterium]